MTTQQERLSIALLFLFILTPRQQWCVASPVRQMIQEQDKERRLQLLRVPEHITPPPGVQHSVYRLQHRTNKKKIKKERLISTVFRTVGGSQSTKE